VIVESAERSISIISNRMPRFGKLQFQMAANLRKTFECARTRPVLETPQA
jgi:hypothetical protein